MSGCIIGLALFARVLSWLFKNHHDISVAILAGVMLGSIRKIWPWQEVVSTRINSHGEEVPFIVKNIFPGSFGGSELLVVLLITAGVVIVFYLERFQLTKEQTSDIENKMFEKEHKKSLQNQ